MKTVVIAEDSCLIRRAMSSWLEGKFEVHGADNAHLALKLIDRHRADYLILNPLLAGNSGWELLYEINTWSDMRRLKTILLAQEADYLQAHRRSLRELNIHTILAPSSLTPRLLRQSLLSKAAAGI